MKENRIYITRVDANKLFELVTEARHAGYRGSHYLLNLLAELERANIVDQQAIPADVVTMNSKVSLLDVDAGEEMIWTLVFPEEADLGEGKISVLAPIGTAMLGYREGDTFEWETPGGKCNYKVQKILYQPEASGDYEL